MTQPSTAAGKNICNPIRGSRVRICSTPRRPQRDSMASSACSAQKGLQEVYAEMPGVRTQESRPQDLIMVLRNTNKGQPTHALQAILEVSSRQDSMRRRSTGQTAYSSEVVMIGISQPLDSGIVSGLLVLSNNGMSPVQRKAGRLPGHLLKYCLLRPVRSLTIVCACQKGLRPEASPAHCPDTAAAQTQSGRCNP